MMSKAQQRAVAHKVRFPEEERTLQQMVEVFEEVEQIEAAQHREAMEYAELRATLFALRVIGKAMDSSKGVQS